MGEKQMVWHAYHAETLCQFVDLESRRADIEEIKPEHELPTRRRLMGPVVGELPNEFLDACEKESATWDARGVHQYATREARKVSYTKHKAEIERLHAIECLGCPWDGETIFPEENN